MEDAGVMYERPRFFVWYRVLPILVMAALLAVSLGVRLVPATVVRTVLYPVHHTIALNDSASRTGKADC